MNDTPIHSRPLSAEGRDNYDRIFRKKPDDRWLRAEIQPNPHSMSNEELEKGLLEGSDDWRKSYPGKCDLCQQPKPLSEIRPGVEFGWRVGYVCSACSPTRIKNETP